MAETFSFNSIPTNVAELMALPESSMDSAYKTTALAILVLLQFEKDQEGCYQMLDALRGPEPMTPYAKSFIKERIAGKAYKVKSFFAGASCDNGYEPTVPYTITVSETPYSFNEENWATMYVTSAGADSPRSIKLRKKPSTGQWFINEIQCLSDIREPKASDPWA